MDEGANPISASSADVWRENYTYPEVQSYFGIVDRNENVQPIEGKTLNCFSKSSAFTLYLVSVLGSNNLYPSNSEYAITM